MNGRMLGILGGAALLALAGWLLLVQQKSPSAEELRRDLSRFRAEVLPESIPASWLGELQERLSEAPVVSLLDSRAATAAREVLGLVSWVDPDSIETSLRLPEGLQVSFRMRAPALRYESEEGGIAWIARDGTCLAPGSEADWPGLPAVRVVSGSYIPLPGRRFADALVQESLRALDEFHLLRKYSGLDLRRIERSPEFPPDAAVPPPLMFVTRNEREIVWGRSDASRDPLGVSLDRKARRLNAFLGMYPGLQGVKRVYLDRPQLYALDEQHAPAGPPDDPL